MKKRAKDVTLGDVVVTESGLMDVKTVSTDMIVGTTMLGWGPNALIFEPYEEVETVD
ncbi:gp52.1 [Streptomyces phage phiBT1]|uniref:Gp52.1 n=1 Tax=Lomovskayavirus BT1 TaxID=225588 RepID=Q859A5_9CAUD|nr:gp52.1 [Streptomyces phage phiBT1]CAD80120.1 gp52.1 [Lomovskayavirus BT1]